MINPQVYHSFISFFNGTHLLFFAVEKLCNFFHSLVQIKCIEEPVVIVLDLFGFIWLWNARSDPISCKMLIEFV